MVEQSPNSPGVLAGVLTSVLGVPVPTAVEGDDGDLAESLTALSGLSAARLSLEDLLTRVATFAVHAIPGADGAGLTLIEHDRSDTIVKSAEFVKQVDDIQYGIEEGPCITAAATGRTVRSGLLSGDPRWPRFGPRAGRLGCTVCYLCRYSPGTTSWEQ